MVTLLAAPVRWALALRSRPLFFRAEQAIRTLPPVDRLAKRAYASYKRRTLTDASTDAQVRAAMLGAGRLPEGFGRGMDERIVEYPWVLARLPSDATRILDAGSTLNYEWVADLPQLEDRKIVSYTLAPEGTLGRRNYSYVYGDLRSTLLRDGWADAIVCVSTLEHVGMDNTGYTGEARDVELDPESYRDVLRELRRVLRPGGSLFVTVPFGASHEIGWLRQFALEDVADLSSTFGPTTVETDFFRHDARAGWQRVPAEACADARYLQVRNPRTGVPTATMATALACVHLRRDDA